MYYLVALLMFTNRSLKVSLNRMGAQKFYKNFS